MAGEAHHHALWAGYTPGIPQNLSGEQAGEAGAHVLYWSG